MCGRWASGLTLAEHVQVNRKCFWFNSPWICLFCKAAVEIVEMAVVQFVAMLLFLQKFSSRTDALRPEETFSPQKIKFTVRTLYKRG